MGFYSPDPPRESDESLWEKAAGGDVRAEEELILRYNRVVRACARPLFLAGGDSEDLLQEGLLGLITAVRSYKPENGALFRTYAEVCIRSRLLSAVRSAGRAKHQPLNTSLPLDSPEAEGMGTSLLDPEAALIAREAWEERLARLEEALSPLEKQVLRYYLNGLSYQEIAEATHKSAKSADNAVQRIRRKLARP